MNIDQSGVLALAVLHANRGAKWEDQVDAVIFNIQQIALRLRVQRAAAVL